MTIMMGPNTKYLALFIGSCFALTCAVIVSGEKNDFLNRQVKKSFSKAAITCDAPLCSGVARSILEKGGTIADASIAGMICMGVVHPQSSGIGGGLAAVHYSPKTKKSFVINARETAASAANEAMFDTLPTGSSASGGLAIAVMGEVKGFLELYTRFGGKVPWEDLFTPSIEILINGFQVDAHLANAFRSAQQYIINDEAFSVFVNKTTGKVYVEGDTIKMPEYAETLAHIAKFGAETFYDPTSTLAQNIILDLKRNQSIITSQDLYAYNVTRQNAVQAKLENGNTVFTAGPPSSGASMAFILRILGKYRNQLKTNDITTSQILIEAFKHTYGRRGKNGDPDDPAFSNTVATHIREMAENEEYLQKVLSKISLNSTSNNATYYKNDRGAKSSGTAHFSIIGADGDSIACTTTLGNFFGAKIRGPRTGIIFNNKMNNFALNIKTRSSSPNKIRPGRRPVNTACPSIHTDSQGVVRLTVGGAGGMKIISAVSSVTINHIWLGLALDDAISARRLHHALSPMKIEYEPEFNETVLEGLMDIGHEIASSAPTANVVGISRDNNGILTSSTDPRKGGSVDGLNFDVPSSTTTTKKTTTTTTTTEIPSTSKSTEIPTTTVSS